MRKRQQKQSISLRKKLIFSYFLLLFIAVFAYSLLSYQNSNRYLKAEKKFIYANNASTIAENLNTRLHNYSVFSMVVSSNGSVQRFFAEPPEDILDQRKIVNETIEPLLESFKILNPDILSVTLYHASTDVKIRSSYIQYITPEQFNADSVYRTEYPWQLKSGNLAQYTSIFYVYGDFSIPIGYLEIVLDAPKVFQSALSNDEIGLFTEIYTKNEQLIWSNVSHTDSQTGKDKGVAITRVPIDNSPLTIDFSLPVRNFYAGINNSAIKSILPMLVLCVASSILFISLYYFVITKNIRKLTNIVDNIDQTNLNIKLDFEQKDEIGILADCINGMLSRINVLISDIYQSKEDEKQAELNALRTQINPHFLYNTMDVINWMAISKDTDSICNVTGLISQYYRTMLNNGEYYTTFADELSNIRSYIGIQLIMHANSFDVQYDYDEQLLKNKVPNFILQPAVENAILHGINAVTDRRCLLHIVLRKEDDFILVEITDNGAGITPEQQQSINKILQSDSKQIGYGLRNVQERIQLAFGPEYGLTLSGNEENGCTTTFRLPFIKGMSL